MVPAYTMPPNAQDVNDDARPGQANLSRALVDTLADDIAEACETLEEKGGASESERARQDGHRLLA